MLATVSIKDKVNPGSVRLALTIRSYTCDRHKAFYEMMKGYQIQNWKKSGKAFMKNGRMRDELVVLIR